MEQYDFALLARTNGDGDASARHMQSAFSLESKAANSLVDSLEAEPTRSVLFRSAATLARDCKRYADAEDLIGKAFEGSPPPKSPRS
jgi:hypothetical protein